MGGQAQLVYAVMCIVGLGINIDAQESDTCNVEQPEDLNLDHAMQMIKLSKEKATELKTPVTICIRDRHDNLVLHARMENALLGSVALACQKARSSSLFPAPSSALGAFPGIVLSNGIISGLQGGLPLVTEEGVQVGSIGVSGASTGAMDEEIAKVAADQIDPILRDPCSVWIATGEVPNKLAEVPPAPLELTYNKKNIMINEMVATEEMLDRPELKWDTQIAALYTIFLVDFGIERLQGQQYIHWLVTNVPNGAEVKSGDEVQEYIPPFYFGLTEDGSAIDQTKGGSGHDIMALVYKQKTGKVDMADERQFGCDPSIVNARIGDHVAIAEKYDLELVAGTFFITTYTDATDPILCYMSKCTGEPFPIPAPGINDGPECKRSGSFGSSNNGASSTVQK